MCRPFLDGHPGTARPTLFSPFLRSKTRPGRLVLGRMARPGPANIDWVVPRGRCKILRQSNMNSYLISSLDYFRFFSLGYLVSKFTNCIDSSAVNFLPLCSLASIVALTCGLSICSLASDFSFLISSNLSS